MMFGTLRVYMKNGELKNIGFDDGAWLVNEIPEAGFIFSEVYHVDNIENIIWQPEEFDPMNNYDVISHNCQDYADHIAAQIRKEQGY